MKLNSALWLCSVIVTIAFSNSNSAPAQDTGVPPEVMHYADTVFYNGKVLTADEKFTTAEAVAVREGKFLAIGNSARILRMAGPQTRKIDLKGKGLIPGIVDLHQHPFTEGMLSYWADKWLPNEPEWSNAQQALAGIKRAVSRAKPGQVVLLPRIYIGPAKDEKGGRTNEAICDVLSPEEKYRSTAPCAIRNSGNLCRFLTRAQIDSVSPDNPVVFVAIVNLGPWAINSKAAEILKPHLPPDVSPFDEEGTACVLGASNVIRKAIKRRGDETNLPTQIARDYLMFWSEPLEDQMVAYRNASKGISAAGITLTKEHTALPLITGIRELWARGELTVRMRMPYPLTPMTSVGGPDVSIPPEQAETLFRRIGNMSGIGDDMLRFMGPRTAAGGNLMSGGAWTIKPRIRQYTSPEGVPALPYGGGGPGEGLRGPLKPGDEIFPAREAVVQAVRFGWDFSSDHTIGDRAVRELLDAMEEGLKTQIVKRPNQILHLGHTPIASSEDIERMKRLGVNASIGPWHIFLPEMLEAGVSQFGTEEFDKMAAPMKTYIKVGLHPALEGDVAGAIFWRMEKAITRKDDLYGRLWNRTESVTRQEALWMSSLWGAQMIKEDDRLGSIEVGKLADAVVIDKDYMSIPEDQIHTIQTLLTMVNGKVVFEVPDALK